MKKAISILIFAVAITLTFSVKTFCQEACKIVEGEVFSMGNVCYYDVWSQEDKVDAPVGIGSMVMTCRYHALRHRDCPSSTMSCDPETELADDDIYDFGDCKMLYFPKGKSGGSKVIAGEKKEPGSRAVNLNPKYVYWDYRNYIVYVGSIRQNNGFPVYGLYVYDIKRGKTFLVNKNEIPDELVVFYDPEYQIQKYNSKGYYFSGKKFSYLSMESSSRNHGYGVKSRDEKVFINTVDLSGEKAKTVNKRLIAKVSY